MYHSVRKRGEGIGCGASYGVDYKETKKEGAMICTPFTGQTSKGGIYYALLIRIQNEMCRIISTRNMG